MKTFYRAINPVEESYGTVYDSNRRSPFRENVFAYRFSSHDIYVLAQKTGLQIKNAVRIAINVPAFLDVLNEFFFSGKEYFNLQELMINDPIKKISGDNLYAFTNSYVQHVNDLNLCYDIDKCNFIWEFIWEVVRYSEFPNEPSRMESLFLFNDKDTAKEFIDDFHEGESFEIAEVNLTDTLVHKYDMSWFTLADEEQTLNEVMEFARKYWSGIPSGSPVWEYLYQGNYELKKLN